MVTTDLVNQAILFATQAHWGQTDKAGQPYILHPLRVMDYAVREAVRNGLGAEWFNQLRVTAVLHDVMEDCPVTVEDLLKQGFPKTVITSLNLLTKAKGEGRIGNAHRIIAAGDITAIVVKMADLQDNGDVSRFLDQTGDYLSKPENQRRLKEYTQVWAMLSEALFSLKSQGKI